MKDEQDQEAKLAAEAQVLLAQLQANDLASRREQRSNELQHEMTTDIFEQPPISPAHLTKSLFTRNQKRSNRQEARRKERARKWEEYEKKLGAARVRAARKRKAFEERKEICDAMFARKQMLAACKSGCTVWRLPKSRFARPRQMTIKLDTLASGALVIR